MNITTNNNDDDVSAPTTTATTPANDDKIRDTIDDSALQQKYNLLKKRVREIEEDNDAIHNKLTKAMRQIKRLRVERIVLLEELDNSRQYRRERKAAASDSEGSVTDSVAMKDTLKTTGKKARGMKSKGSSKHQHNQENGSAATTPTPRKKRDPNAPKGPGNVFFLYCRLERDNIKDQLSSDNLGEATRLLGQKWKALSKDEKKVYYDMYNKEQKEFEAAMELYNAGGGAAGQANKTNGTKAIETQVKKDKEDPDEDEDVDMLHEDEEEDEVVEDEEDDDVDDEEDDGATTITDQQEDHTPAPISTDEPVTTDAATAPQTKSSESNHLEVPNAQPPKDESSSSSSPPTAPPPPTSNGTNN